MINNIKYFSIRLFATVTTKQGALIIAGYDVSISSNVRTVACYNSEGWNKLDDLQTGRHRHRAIVNGDKVYIVGGVGEQ